MDKVSLVLHITNHLVINLCFLSEMLTHRRAPRILMNWCSFEWGIRYEDFVARINAD